MEPLVTFIKKTKELKAHLESEWPADKRDEYIEKLNTLLHERQQSLQQMGDLSALNESSKTELVNLEKTIQALMKKHHESIKQDIKVLQLKKQKNQFYANPYENLSTDGTFLDKKK